ncbi:MAG: family 10 glycosylhydrolase, partial [Thermoguttaceae bacterium]|nr:family 10 glycosylhydrolase [Thermoguttaceae bacterium]
MTRAALIILFVLAVLTAHGADPPASPREFRAVWVATVGNIDWPSKPGLPVEEQQREAVAILDEAARLHLNAVIFQVRPAADALYRSELEPWSYYLTGR